MKELAAEFQFLGNQYKSNVTKLFTSSVKFQKQTHLDTIPKLVVQSIFRICHQDLLHVDTVEFLVWISPRAMPW
jgi:hypothetical protein